MTLRAIGLLCLALGLAQPAAARDNSGPRALDRRERLFGWEAVGPDRGR